MSNKDLANEGTESLWLKHATVVATMKRKKQRAPKLAEVSLLDLKVELARRMMSNCQLCAHRCGVNRIQGELGICRLGTDVLVAEHFVHIAEEAPINPSLVLNLAGCGLRCRFCQQFALLEPNDVNGQRLDGDLWPMMDIRGARSLSFVGGNPDESSYAILQFLRESPFTWRLPVVWNCHGYATPDTVILLDGVVDVFVPDFKYGNEDCGRRLSGVSNYPTNAKTAIATMLAQTVPVIVRILVLPGHLDCCHSRTIETLAAHSENRNLFVSVRGQYCPDWKISSRDGSLARRVSAEEVSSITQHAREVGLQLIG